MVRLAVSSVLVVWVGVAVAWADSKPSPGDPRPGPALVGPRIAVPMPVPAARSAAPRAQISGLLYLERCRVAADCLITNSANNARERMSTIPMGQPTGGAVGRYQLTEFKKDDPDKNQLWNAFVQCMKEVYSPYRVEVTDVKPGGGFTYHMAIVAGLPSEVGYSDDILGVAPLASDCSPQDNVISFSFANAHPQTGESLVKNLCWTAAQESAHAFGLDHQYEFIESGRSACNDPMTYRVDCGGQKFFRNEAAKCGEFTTRQCRCGVSQNSHVKLLSVFDAGQSIVPPPTVEITAPPASATTLGATVIANAGSKRGIARAELLLNNYPWAAVGGAPFALDGQPDPSAYTLQVPDNVPNSIIDIRVRAYDDLDNYTDSAAITVTKGAPCTSAESCAVGQKCESGRCFWDPPAGELGDSCAYPQFCVSARCEGEPGAQICTKECIPGVEDTCPSDLACQATSTGKGLCVLDGGGCCSTSRGRSPWAHLVFAALTLALVIRRTAASRRRPAAPRARSLR